MTAGSINLLDIVGSAQLADLSVEEMQVLGVIRQSEKYEPRSASVCFWCPINYPLQNGSPSQPK